MTGNLYWEVIEDASSGEFDPRRTPIILVRGLGRSARYWMGMERLIARRRKVMLVDARGLGRSRRKMGWFDSVWTMADDLVECMNEARIEKAYVLGLSLGGMVTIASAIRYPDRVAGVVLGATSMRNWRALRITPRAIVTLLKARRAGQGLSESCAKVLISPDTEPAHRARVLAAWDANVALEGLPALTVIKQLLAAGRFGPWRALRRLNLPVLVMVGDRDVFVPARNSEFIAAQVPQARLVRLPGAAHEFTDDHPEASAAAVDAFLGEIEARA